MTTKEEVMGFKRFTTCVAILWTITIILLVAYNIWKVIEMSSEEDRYIEAWIEQIEEQERKDMQILCQGCPVYLGDYYMCPYGGIGENCIYA